MRAAASSGCAMSGARLAAVVALVMAPPAPLVAAAAQQRGINVRRYEFHVILSDTGDAITARAHLFVRRVPGAPDTLLLDLVGMSVDSVGLILPPKYPVEWDYLAPVPFRYDGRVLRVPLGRRAPRDDHVVVFYHGAPRDGLIVRGDARGRRSFFADNWPNRARYWLPTVDYPGDKAEVRWTIEAPRGWRVVANGVCSYPGVGRVRAYCEETHPIPTYTMVLGATEMSVSHHRYAASGGDSIPVEIWTYPEDSAFADSVPFRRATEIVEAMQRLVGPFPYEKLAHVESSTRYGGMENSTAIFYPESAYFERRLREGTVRHETAHQWFGDAVTERDWHHLWLSEGFASYFDLVIGAALDGDSVLAAGMRRNAERYMDSTQVVERPIVDTTVTDLVGLLNENNYQKGAWVLHMLRAEIGDSAFFRGVREYYRIYRDSTALSADFQRVMERAAGRPLDWFFRQWLHQPGYPQIDVRWVSDSASRQVVLYVRQAQPAAWGRFRLPAVPVVFAGVEGPARRTLALDPRYPEQVASFTVDRMPSGIRIDPDGTLLLTATVHR